MLRLFIFLSENLVTALFISVGIVSLINLIVDIRTKSLNNM